MISHRLASFLAWSENSPNLSFRFFSFCHPRPDRGSRVVAFSFVREDAGRHGGRPLHRQECRDNPLWLSVGDGMWFRPDGTGAVPYRIPQEL